MKEHRSKKYMDATHSHVQIKTLYLRILQFILVESYSHYIHSVLNCSLGYLHNFKFSRTLL